ncbi:hypothetical protein N7508_003996 [Penicillium antarcticum]|uniref:uncharacterized protein n=1 Tax=Penicillium antarcticum TaxID=416450 RepID=UPI0023957802|nr:uncharacterized protein N7508_003996 [Penicillium antarcticum]KAJ5308617.1 hypothetical protein N7508_003996 [Penicillium antarcticum]
MAKTATHKQVTKSSSARSTPSKTSNPSSGSIDRDLLFLWSCCQSASMRIDFPAVAQVLGIKPNAARMRFARLKTKLDAMEEEQKRTVKTEPEDNNQPEGASAEQDKVKEESEDAEVAQF